MAVPARKAHAFFTVLVVLTLREASGLTAAARSSELPKTLGRRSKSSSSAATTRGGQINRAQEEFSVVADQALQNLSTQFSQFRNILASRSTQLTEALQREERTNHAVEDANVQISKAIYGLKHDNQGLRGKAKILIAQNEQLRGELRSLQSRLQAAEAFASSGVEGSFSSEAADMEAAENPPAPLPPAPPTVEAADNGASSVVTMSAADAAGTAASNRGGVVGGIATQAEAVAPAVQAEEDDDGVGYADAFTGGGDDGGSIMERPPPENEGPDNGMADEDGFGPALLAVSSKRHRRLGRHGGKRLRRRHVNRHPAASSALPQIPSDLLPSTAEGFAKLEKTSVASLQRRFDLQLQRLHARHDELLQKQATLNTTRHSDEALHSRLAAAVTQLAARHDRLQRHGQSIADFLERLVAVAQGPEAKAAAALRAVPTAPGGN